jgi:pilus assembly protein TadC
MTVQLLIVAGALAGLGATLIIRELLPAHPDLTDALAHLHGPSDQNRQQTRNVSAPSAASWSVGLDRLGRRLTAEVRQRRVLPLPLRDLDLLGRPVDQFLLTKLGLGLLGLAFPHALAALMGTLGLRLPLVVPVVASLAFAAGLFLVPDIDVRARAQARRAEFRRAVCAYLDLVALERAGDAGAVESMERAAGVARGWAFTRIHDALLRARLDGVPPWAGLDALADELDLPELGDVADIMRLSGEDGAAVYDTLRARAQSLRTTVLTEHEARANSDSEKMVAPVAFLGIVFIALLGYPAFARIVFG